MKPETLGEVHIIFQNIDEKMDSVLGGLQQNTKAIQDLEVRVKTTNGQIVELKRINKEDVIPLVSDYQINRERIKGAVIFGSVIATIVIAMFMFMGKLYLDAKERIITENVSNAVYEKIIKEFDVIVNK